MPYQINPSDRKNRVTEDTQMETIKQTLPESKIKKFSAHEKQLISFLQEYIQIDTSHPQPDYQKAVTFLTNNAKKDGLEYRVITLPRGNPVVVITLPGTNPDLPALALNHHIDVVPAPNAQEWKYPPFSGHLENDVMFGRGTQDIKGLGAIHYFALKKIKDLHGPLTRTIHLLMVPDEETGGSHGVKELIKIKEFKELNIGFIVDEAGGSGDENTLAIKVDERKVFQLTFVAKGEMVHGSTITNQNCVHEMILFLSNLVRLQHIQYLNTQNDNLEIGNLLSINVSSFKSGVFNKGKASINTIPSTAQATTDIRIPPGMKIETVRHHIEELLQNYPNISCIPGEVSTEVKTSPPHQSLLLKILIETIHSKNMHAKQFICPGSSDLRSYKLAGLTGVGFVPYTIKCQAHGTNEHIRIKDLVFGVDFMYNFLLNFCLQP
jgi:N-acyl-L-amino-acid amidohydrolase